MRKLSVLMAALVLFACGNEPPPAPKPAPVTPPPAPKPQASAPAPAPVAAPAPAPKPDPNRELAVRVKRALEDEAKVQGSGIDVTADNGKVTLWGTAASAAERARAAQVASKVAGVTSVENKLAVVKGS